jgi:hypothetical protein
MRKKPGRRALGKVPLEGRAEQGRNRKVIVKMKNAERHQEQVTDDA